MKSIILAAAAIGMVSTPAFAGPATAPTTAVSYEGLDLATAEGQKILDARIDSAARSLCRMDEVRTGTRLKSAESRACYAKARASAKKQVASVVAEHQLGG